MGTPELLRRALAGRRDPAVAAAVEAAPLRALALAVHAGLTVWDIRELLEPDGAGLDEPTLAVMASLRG